VIAIGRGHRITDGAGCQAKGRLFELGNHLAAREPAQIATIGRTCGIDGELLGERIKGLASGQPIQDLPGFFLRGHQDVTRVDLFGHCRHFRLERRLYLVTV